MPDLFKGGSLEMSPVPIAGQGAEMLWADCMVNRIAVLSALILFVIELVDLFRLYPSLWRCVLFWKGNLELEHSVSLARTRNTVALVMAVFLCLIADRWQLIAPSFKMELPQEWHLAVCAGVILGYILVRRLAYLISRFRSLINEYDCTLRHSMYNYQILLTSLMLVTAFPLTAFGVADSAVRIVLLIEFAALTLLYLIRTIQILSSRFAFLATILYLCALEMLPLGILILVCTL
jgi:hypothetical protein